MKLTLTVALCLVVAGCTANGDDPAVEAQPSVATTAARQVVINDTDGPVTLLCEDCPQDGVEVEASGRTTFVRVDSDHVRFVRPDGTATCIGYGSPMATGDVASGRQANELFVSQGGNCLAFAAS